MSRNRKSTAGSAAADVDSFLDSSADDMEDTDFRDVKNDWRYRGRNRRQESSEETAPDSLPSAMAQKDPTLEVELRAALHQVLPQQN